MQETPVTYTEIEITGGGLCYETCPPQYPFQITPKSPYSLTLKNYPSPNELWTVLNAILKQEYKSKVDILAAFETLPNLSPITFQSLQKEGKRKKTIKIVEEKTKVPIPVPVPSNVQDSKFSFKVFGLTLNADVSTKTFSLDTHLVLREHNPIRLIRLCGPSVYHASIKNPNEHKIRAHRRGDEMVSQWKYEKNLVLLQEQIQHDLKNLDTDAIGYLNMLSYCFDAEHLIPILKALMDVFEHTLVQQDQLSLLQSHRYQLLGLVANIFNHHPEYFIRACAIVMKVFPELNSPLKILNAKWKECFRLSDQQNQTNVLSQKKIQVLKECKIDPKDIPLPQKKILLFFFGWEGLNYLDDELLRSFTHMELVNWTIEKIQLCFQSNKQENIKCITFLLQKSVTDSILHVRLKTTIYSILNFHKNQIQAQLDCVKSLFNHLNCTEMSVKF